MTSLLFLPFLIQMIAIGIDEWVFHRKRGLPKWERIGHPLDTFSIVLCLFFTLLYPCTALYVKIFIGLAVFSCLLVTKDEFIHHEVCPAKEQWLHALLFINHPIMLTAAGLLWAGEEHALPTFLAALVPNAPIPSLFLNFQLAGAFLFFLYQVIYWNFVWREKETA